MSCLFVSAQAFAIPSSTWTGEYSSYMNEPENWSPMDVPYGDAAIFNGNGANSPLAHTMGGLSFDQMEFGSNTDITIITGIETTGSIGVKTNPQTTAVFNVLEHQPLSFPKASLSITSGPVASGGGVVNYNLQGFGQLFAQTGAADSTIVNVCMTGGDNYFEVNGSGTNIFDNVSSDAATDEIYIATNAILSIRGSAINTINGSINGNGGLNKTGTGTLILNAVNTYTGDTTVDQGCLVINGMVQGDVDVNIEALLKGNGEIIGLLSLSGIVEPGNSIGTLSVANFVMDSTSMYTCEVNGLGFSDQIIASGFMSIDGSLYIVPLDTSFSSLKTFSILEAAGGISGSFSSVTSQVPALKALTYTANGVSLNYLPIAAVGLNHNANAAADCYTALSSQDAVMINETLLFLPFSEIQNAFNRMQPSQYSGQTWTQMSNALLVGSSYAKHLRDFGLFNYCFQEFSSQVWIDVMGQWQQQHKKSSQIGFSDWTGGLSVGIDTAYQHFHFGGAASYTYSQVHSKDGFGKGQINSYYGGLYSGWSDGIGYVNVSLLGAYNHYHSLRHIDFANIDRNAEASHHGWEMSAGFEGGVYFKTKHFNVGPFGRLDYVYLWQNGYQERGADSLNLGIKSRQDQLMQTQVGLAFTKDYPCSIKRTKGRFIPRVAISYINQTPIAKSNYKASFQDSACAFSVAGWNFERNLGALEMKLSYLSLSERIGVSLEYEGQFGTKYSNQIGQFVCNVRY